MNTFDDDHLLADGLYRLGSTAPVPSAQPSDDVRRGRRRVRRNRLVVAAGTALAVGIIGGAGVALRPMYADRAVDPAGSPSASSTAASAARAASVARVLPSSIDLAIKLILERDASLTGVPVVVQKPIQAATDEAVATWVADVRKVDGDDQELAELLAEIQRSLDGLRDTRHEMQESDTRVEAESAYTASANDLLAITAHVPSVGDAEIDSKVEALANSQALMVSFEEQRTIMVFALAKGDITSEEFEALAEAEARWRQSLADFYNMTSDRQRETLDRITNGTAADGAVGVPAQETVNLVLSNGNLDRVTVPPEEQIAVSTELIRSLRALYVAAAQEVIDDLAALG